MYIGKILSDLYYKLREDRQSFTITLHHSDVYYIRAGLLADSWEIIKEKDKHGNDITSSPPEYLKSIIRSMPLADMETILREEGLLPYHEYEIPHWYARKWLNEAKKRRNVLVPKLELK